MTQQNPTPDIRHDFVWGKADGLSMHGICKCGEGEDAPVHDPEVKVTHVAIGQGHFYNTTSEAKAKAGFRREGGRLTGRWTMAHFPEGVTYLGVNGMGVLRWRVDVEGTAPEFTDHNEPKR